MRVLHLTPHYEPTYTAGGLAVFTANLARGQVREGADISVLTTSPAPAGETGMVAQVQEGVNVRYCSPRPRSRFGFSWDLLDACWRDVRRFDIAHIHGIWTFASAWGARCAWRSRVPYVVSPHGSLNAWAMRHRPYKKRPYWWLVERRTVLGSAVVHFSTEDEALQAGVWIGNHPVAVIPSAVEIPVSVDRSNVIEWRRRLGIPENAPLVGFLGRLHGVKGLDLLLDAMAQIQGAALVLAGPDEDGTQAGLTSRAAALGITPRIHWPGPLDPQGRSALLAAIDVFVLPSHSENFGLAAAEAMAAGVPVVVTPGVNLAPLIVQAGAGCVVPRDPARLAEVLSALLADPGRRLMMAKAGQRLAEELFSPRAVARQMLQLYQDCLKARG